MNIAVILSGGVGTRLGSDIPKQYIKVKGRMIITYCLKTLMNNNCIDAINIVADPSYRVLIDDDLKDLIGKNPLKDVFYSDPGENRQMSIYNGLCDIYDRYNDNSGEVNVMIHDAARPNLTDKMIGDCFDALNGHQGVMPALPMKDTVYISNDGLHIEKLIDRKTLFAGQAPEVYKLNDYLEALRLLMPDKILKINGSTEPAVMAGLDVVMICGDENNYKITTREDLERFKQLKEE